MPDFWVENELLEQTKAYLIRGRRFRDLKVDELNEKWADAFRRFVRECNGPHSREMDDAGAELRLRGEDFPIHMVGPEEKQLRANVQRLCRELPLEEYTRMLSDFICAPRPLSS